VGSPVRQTKPTQRKPAPGGRAETAALWKHRPRPLARGGREGDGSGRPGPAGRVLGPALRRCRQGGRGRGDPPGADNVLSCDPERGRVPVRRLSGIEQIFLLTARPGAILLASLPDTSTHLCGHGSPLVRADGKAVGRATVPRVRKDPEPGRPACAAQGGGGAGTVSQRRPGCGEHTGPRPEALGKES
jgi:hypothetical protein